MAKKFYVVWAGRETGIFTDWASCKKSIDKFSGARYKSFPSRAEAEGAFNGSSSKSNSTAGKTISEAGKNKAPAGKNKAPKSITESGLLGQHEVEIFCDGGCDPNPGRSGSGVAVYQEGKLTELWYGLYNPCGTNNTAELNALHQSLLIAEKAIDSSKTVAIYCDSLYSINCVSVWAYSWKKKGWKKPSGDIKNLVIIKEIHSLYENIREGLQLLHVKAHCGIEGNELADRMTMIAVDRQEYGFAQYAEKVDVSLLLKLRAG